MNRPRYNMAMFWANAINIHATNAGKEIKSSPFLRPIMSASKAAIGAPTISPNGKITATYDASSAVMLSGKSSEISLGYDGDDQE